MFISQFFAVKSRFDTPAFHAERMSLHAINDSCRVILKEY